jgi:gamma-glutamyltranspeptidase / glutathione hydrolase
VPAVAVASSSRLAAEAGAGVAESGGNAVDAAVAALLVSLVTEPGICSLAGGAYVTVWHPGDEPMVVDGNSTVPGRGLPAGREPSTITISTDYAGGMSTTVGHGSVAVPGAPAALDLAIERFGELPWREVVAPSIAVARRGFPLPPASDHYLGHVHDVIYGIHAESRALLHHPDGRRLAGGDTVRIPDLAASLETIAEEGTAAFYQGPIAEAICGEMAENGGLVTADDLASYRAEIRPALGAPLDGWRIATNPAPAIGGAAVVALLELTAGHPDGPWTAVDVARFAAAHRAIVDHRRRELDSAEDRIAAIERLVVLATADPSALLGAPSTVHTSVVDDDGVACSITASAGYGSGIIASGTGIWLNNALGEHELVTGRLHDLEPGERLTSNMAPTVARHDDGRLLAIGSPGADRITTAIAQVLASFVRGTLPLTEAVAHPRVHVERDEAGGVRLAAEAGAPIDAVDLPVRHVDGIHMSFGGVAAALLHRGGAVEAAADPRRDGGTATFTTEEI